MRQTVQLFKRTSDGSLSVPATKLEDLPVGEMRMENEVVQRFVITKNREGHLMLIVECKRAPRPKDDDESAE